MTAPNDFWVQQLAELRREIRELKAQRVGYVQAPVTAVDAASSTFTVQPPAQQDGATTDLAGLSSPAHFLPDVGDQVLLAVSGAKPIYQPGRIAAGAIGYPELSPDVTLDIGNGNSVTFSPNPPSGDGHAAGDIWWQTSGSSVVGGWQWDGTTWEPHTFGDQILDSLTAAKITSGRIAAGVEVDIGDPAAEYTALTGTALTFNSVTPDGVPYQVSQFGKSQGGTDASGNTVWQIDSAGGASFTDLSSDNDPIFSGTALSDMLAPLTSFYAGASRGADSDPALTAAGGGETGFYEMTVEFQPGHIYLIQSSNIWVRPSGSGTTRIDLNLHYTLSTDPAVDPPAVSIGSNLFARAPGGVDAANSFGASRVISRLYRVTQYAQFRFLLSLATTGGQGYIELGSADFTEPTLGTPMEPDSVQLMVLDLGENPWTNRAVLNTGGGGGTTPAPVKRYTYDYFSHWSRWFRGDGSVAGDNGDCYQGQTPFYVANGDEATQIGQFTRPNGGPSLHTDLQGATIEGLWVYLYANHWHYDSGGTAVIRYHNNASAGSLNNFAGGINVSGWARGQGRWVSILGWASLFQGTAAQGIQVGKANSTDPIFYGVFDGPGSPNAPRIRATFTK